MEENKSFPPTNQTLVQPTTQANIPIEAPPTSPASGGFEAQGTGETGGVPQTSSEEKEAFPISPPAPKKGFPKIILVLISLFLIVFLGIVIFRFASKGLKISKEKTIVWWGLWEDEAIVKSLIDEYQNKNTNIKISYVKQAPQDYRERLINSLAKGQGPDIFRIHNTWVPMFKNELSPVPASVMSAADFTKTYYSVIASDVTSGTGLAGIPLGYDALVLFVNEEIFSANNKSYPATWDDFRQLACELTRVENSVIIQSGAAMGRTENVDHWQEILGTMMIQNGVNLASPKGKRAEDSLIFFSMFSSGRACPGAGTGVWDGTLPASTQAFAAGKVAMYFAPSWRAFEIQKQNPELKFKTITPPQLIKENPEEPDISYATYWVEGVWQRSSFKDEAWKFLNYMAQKDALEKFFQGASKSRGFGEAYPRTDMQNLLIDHPILGSIIKLAPDAQSWYLASRTFDGPTGINSQINKYFEDAVNAVVSGKSAESALETVSQGISQVLSQYGLTR